MDIERRGYVSELLMHIKCFHAYKMRLILELSASTAHQQEQTATVDSLHHF